MTEPIEVMVKRYRCPGIGCRRSLASKTAMVEHISRCWYVPENHGCKTCRHYAPAERGSWVEPGADEYCKRGVDLSSPITGCDLWERRCVRLALVDHDAQVQDLPSPAPSPENRPASPPISARGGRSGSGPYCGALEPATAKFGALCGVRTDAR